MRADIIAAHQKALTWLSNEMAPHPQVVGRYNIRGLIGHGGMGMLFLAWDPKLEREVALKVLREGVDSSEMLERFSREARSAARLRHPHIVTIFDVGDHEGRPYISMEYVTGQTLGDMVRTSQPLSVSRKIELLEELCSGLGYAHRQGIVHRDIKPANLMVDSEGVLKILDFGIAKVSESMMTQSGVLIGTLNYMSPEQVAGEPVDPRSDIFAVGAVGYELFTYRMAFPGNLQNGILHKILHVEPEPLETLCPWLDDDVIQIIERALAKQPDARYQDLKAMRADLHRARQNLEERAAESTQLPPPDLRKPGRGSALPTPARSSRELEEIGRRRQSQIQSWLDEAERLLSTEDFAGAVTAVENALLLDAEDSRALALYDQARARLDVRQARDWALEAEEHLQRGAMTLAEELIARAIALDPNSPVAARVRESVTATRQKRDEERRTREAIDVAISDGARLIDLGDFEQALSVFERVLQQEPAHPEALALGNSARQELDARNRRALQTQAREAVSAARAEFASGRHEKAIAALNDFAPPHELVSAALDDLRRHHAGLLEQARVGREQLEIAAHALGAGDVDAAERAVRIAEDSGAPDEMLQGLRAGIRQARVEAERRAEKAREEQQRRVAAAAALERAKRAKDPRGAIDALKEALRLDPQNAAGRRLLEEQQRILEQEKAARREQERRTAAARALVARAAKTASHTEAVALLREAVLTDPSLADANKSLAERERALEAAIAERKERDRRREQSRRLVDRAAATPSHVDAIAILREALALDDPSGVVQAKLSERETALAAERAAAAERHQRRESARRLVSQADRITGHAAAIIILRNAVALDGELDEAQRALAQRERAQAAEIAAAEERQREAARLAEIAAAAERQRQDEAARLAEVAAERQRQLEPRPIDQAPDEEAPEDVDQTRIAGAPAHGFYSGAGAKFVIRAPVFEPPDAGDLLERDVPPQAAYPPVDEDRRREATAEAGDAPALPSSSISVPRVRRVAPSVKPLLATAGGVAVIAGTLLVWRALSGGSEPPLTNATPTTGVTTTAPTLPSVSPNIGTGGPPPIVTSTVPAVTSAPDLMAKAADLRRLASAQLQSQPAEALQLLAEALRLQPEDQASRRLLDRVAQQARNLSTQARTQASGNRSSVQFSQAQRSSDLAERLYKQGDVEAAARAWLDARAAYDGAAAETTQIAGAETAPTVPAPPPVTTSPPPGAATPIPSAPAPTSIVAPTPTTVENRAPVRTDDAVILDVLQRYADAYSRLDVGGVAAVFPGAKTAAIRRSFEDFRALEMVLENVQVSVAGDRATASCVVRQTSTAKAGRPSEQRTPARFELRKDGDNWLIVSRR